MLGAEGVAGETSSWNDETGTNLRFRKVVSECLGEAGSQGL